MSSKSKGKNINKHLGLNCLVHSVGSRWFIDGVWDLNSFFFFFNKIVSNLQVFTNFQRIRTQKQSSVSQTAVGIKTTDGSLELRRHSHRGVAVQADVQIILQSVHGVPRQPLQKHAV